MKRVLSGVLQFVLFLAVFLVGSLLPAANLLPMVSVNAGPDRIFVLDGLFLMLAVYLAILLIAVARKRLLTAWSTSSLALALAIFLGLAMKFGFKSI
jgi:hypothetical protein